MSRSEPSFLKHDLAMQRSGYESQETADARRRDRLRFALGCLQMLAAIVSFVLILEDGITRWSLVGVVITCLLTTISVIRFGSRPRTHDTDEGEH